MISRVASPLPNPLPAIPGEGTRSLPQDFHETDHRPARVSSGVRAIPHVAVGLFLLTAAHSRAANVTVDLVPSVTAVEPGGKLTVAAVFKIEKGWHLYWINPGETGSPPELKWTTPAGLTVGSPQFPTPKTINANGLTAYGYERSLVVLYDVTVPKDASGEIELKANADWVVCSNLCVAEQQAVSVKVPVAAERGSANEPQKFDQWRARQPKRVDSPVIATIDADGKHGSLDMKVSPGSTFAEFFPPLADFAEWEKPTVDGDTVRARFRVFPNPPATHVADAITVTKDQSGPQAVIQQVQFRFQSSRKE